MSETLALARLSIAKSRLTMVVMVAWAACSVGIAAGTTAIFPRIDATPILFMLLLLPGVWSCGMFDFGGPTVLVDGRSGYQPWLLQQPIAAWKLAIVPLTLRTLWICLGWGTIVVAERVLSGDELPIVSAATAFSACGVWIGVLAWQPFRNGWWRAGMMWLVGGSLPALIVLVFVAHSRGDSILWMTPTLKMLLLSTGFLLFGAGVAMAIGAVRSARVNAVGLVPEYGPVPSRAKMTSGADAVAETSVELRHRTRCHALAWHDWRLMRSSERYAWMATIVLMYAGLGAFGLKMQVVLAMFVILLYMNVGIVSTTVLFGESSKPKQTLPPCIAAAPFTCAEIGYTRAVTTSALSFMMLGLASLTFVTWLLWPSARAELSEWMRAMNASYDSPFAAYRIIVAAGFACVVLAPSRTLGYLWSSLTGKSRYQLTAVCGPLVACFIVGIAGIVWFLQQPDWNAVMQGVGVAVSWIPVVSLVSLVAKGISSLASGYVGFKRGLLSPQVIVKITIGWAGLVLVTSIIAFLLVPDERLTFLWCLVIATLAIPLARVLLIPYAVSINRHR